MNEYIDKQYQELKRKMDLASFNSNEKFAIDNEELFTTLEEMLQTLNSKIDEHGKNYVEPTYEEDTTEDYLLSKRGDEDDI